MKNKAIIFVVSLLFLQLISCGQQKGAKITFENDVFRLGSVKEEAGNIDVQFTFTNTGEGDLLINRVKADPGITVATWPAKAVAPGESGIIKATFNPLGNADRFNKRITVYTNENKSGKVIYVSGNVIPIPGSISAQYRKTFQNTDLRLNTTFLNLGNVTNKEERVSTIEIINTGESDIALGFKDIPAYVNVSAVPELLKPDQKGQISVVYQAGQIKDKEGKQKWGKQTDRFYVVINDDVRNSSKNLISVRSSIIEDFDSMSEEELAKAPKIEFEELVFDFDTIVRGEDITHDFVYKNLGENDLMIRHVKAS